MASVVPTSLDEGRLDTRHVRDLGLDRFRGALIILMVAGDYLHGVDFVPAFLKHAPDIGLTVADVVAPAFVFAIGLTYRSSFERRAQNGLGGAYRHFLLRYLSLIGIGAIISAGSTTVVGQQSGWGVLQALGAAGLLTLPVVRLNMDARFVIGLLLLGGYQILLDQWALTSVLGSSHGGLVGALSWAALLILSTAVADTWRSGLRRYLVGCLVLVTVTTASVFVVPVSKNRVSLSYVLVSLSLAAVVWLLVSLGSRAVRKPAGFFCWWGENPLVLYLLHLLLLGLISLPTPSWLYSGASIPLAVAELTALLVVTSLTSWWLHRRGIRLTL